MKSIIYIGNFDFPYGNAAGKRVYANGKILRELGYNVIFIGLNKDISINDELENTKDTYNEFDYYNLPYPKRKYDWLRYKDINNKVEAFINTNKTDLNIEYIIYYGSPTISIFNTNIIKYCKKENIKIIADCVDWLTPNSTSKIFNMVKKIDNFYQKAFANKKCDGVIVISEFLEKYYNNTNMKTVLIPPVSPIKYENVEPDNNTKIKIAYAGVPFRIGSKEIDYSKMKDRIDKIIELFAVVKESNDNFILNIYGFNKEDYLNAVPNHHEHIRLLENNIEFHGYLKHNKIVENIRKSDFTILIRDIKRDTTAGFPTKVSESISCGIPVITNKSSDIEKYIIENKHGYFIDHQDMESSAFKIINILNKKPTQINDIKQECLDSEVFYYKNYIIRLKEFLNKI